MRAGALRLALHAHWLLGFAAAISRQELFPYGDPRGDLLLQEGDDETSQLVQLTSPLLFYEAEFNILYVGTNGIISMQDFPRETQYVDDGLPTDFPVIAPFLSDIDTSNGRGKIYYRQDNSEEILNNAAGQVQRGFPQAAFHPTNAFLVTWENVGAYEEVTRHSASSNRFNTFQAVLAFDESDAYAIFLYPEDGLQFFGTRPKESYNVHLELPARVGFSRGESESLKREGPYHSITSSEQSVKNLYQSSNVGVPGVWVFHIGSISELDNVIPAKVGNAATKDRSVSPENSHTSNPEHGEHEPLYTDETVDFPESFYDENDEDNEYPPNEATHKANSGPDVKTGARGFLDVDDPRHTDTKLSNADVEHESTLPDVPYSNPLSPSQEEQSWSPHKASQSEVPLVEPEVQPAETVDHGIPLFPETREGSLQPVTDDWSSYNENVSPYTDSGALPSNTDTLPLYPEGEVLRSHPLPDSDYRRSRVNGDVGFDTDVFIYNPVGKKTCERRHGQCSQHAFCTDYATGFCCHCETDYYGNGIHCLPKGAPHRVNGKVSGNILVGQTPVNFFGVDLHAYVVVNDGRAYTAISHVPQPASWSLTPVSPIGGLFGWLFALEKPGHQNGFSVTGAKFVHNIEVIFYPGAEAVHITQTADGFDSENYINLKTTIHGKIPYIPETSTVQIAPYNELYHYSGSVVTSTAYREYTVISSSGAEQRLSYRLRQNITHHDCSHSQTSPPSAQKLSVDRVFALYNKDEKVVRYAITNHIGSVHGPTSEESTAVNPCYDGTHVCDTRAQCQPATGHNYTCVCASGYQGDGRDCIDMNECEVGSTRCGQNTVCINLPGSYRCECRDGYKFSGDGHHCVLANPPVDPCEHGSHTCNGETSRCIPRGDGLFTCECLAGFVKSGQNCIDVDECAEYRCHPDASCSNTRGSFSCRCNNGYEGDGFQCTQIQDNTPPRTPCLEMRKHLLGALGPQGPRPQIGSHVPQCDGQGNYTPLQCHGSTGYCWCVHRNGEEIDGTRTPPGSNPPRCGAPEPTRRPETICERWRQSLLEHYGGSPSAEQYVPQCDTFGDFSPLQCHGESGYCWCVDKEGREIEGSRTQPGMTPACIPTVAPPIVRPTPRPDVAHPATGTFLLYAQGQQIGYLPLNGTRLHKEKARTLLSLHGSIVVGIDYDCQEKMVYWTDVAGRTISRASLQPGAEPETIINSGLMSTEGLAIDYLRRTMFWTDSGLDKIETSRLDGSERRILFDTDLVNPRAIAVDSVRGNLYWTDWNREAPKIETSFVDGSNRRILVNDDIGLPNGLTFNPFTKQICWADAGTKKLECISANGTGRRVIQSNLNYPFSVVAYANHFYHTDWRRDGVISVNKDDGQISDEYLPDQRSHLYGITAIYPYCPSGRK
ncbi:nidogen-2 isoform X2 [Ascaphus truei]|uniref:nidogen-2 isoform X2 n=1 Tax=Ascaphus truei TaxID=8439 RepID=UPI003F5963A0